MEHPVLYMCNIQQSITCRDVHLYPLLLTQVTHADIEKLLNSRCDHQITLRRDFFFSFLHIEQGKAELYIDDVGYKRELIFIKIKKKKKLSWKSGKDFSKDFEVITIVR